MIRRRNNPHIIITQTAHGWLAGQFAMHWGNDQFAIPALPNEVIMATINHDNGWLKWETAPQLDAQGRPLDFLDMDADTHLDLWQRSIQQLAAQSRYAALLVSLHASFLLAGRLRANDADSPTDKAAIQRFIDSLFKAEAELKASLACNPYFAEACLEPHLQANFRLLQIFDWLSLLVCMNEISDSLIEDVPGATPNERCPIQVQPLTPSSFTIEPWPFNQPKFSLSVQMHHLPQATFESNGQFQAAWHQSQIETRVFSVEKVT